MNVATQELVYPRLSLGRFGFLEAYTDERLFESLGVRIAFTLRSGGVSTGCYKSLNLGDHVGDDLSAVQENRHRLCSALGASKDLLVVPHQVHGDHLVVISDVRHIVQSQEEARVGADGIIVCCEEASALLCFADCMPLIIVSPSGAFAVVHAGWRGVMQEIAAQALVRLVAHDTQSGTAITPDQYNIYIGAHIKAECFETSPEIHAQFVDAFGTACNAGERHIDLESAQRVSLSKVGASESRIISLNTCSVCENERFFSYRAQDGMCGRHGAFAYRPRKLHQEALPVY